MRALIMRKTSGGRGGEEGSVILSVLVALVGTVAVVGLLSSVGSGLNQVRRDQSRATAFQHSNAGVDAALYRIDTKTLPVVSSTTSTGAYTPAFVGGVFVGYDEVLDVGEIRYELVVRQDPVGQDTVWKVRSTGTEKRSGQRRQAIADIAATRTFENGFFTLNQFIITGTQFRNIPVAYDSSGACRTAVASCELPLPTEGTVGTNDLFEGSNATLVSLMEQWSGFNLYGRTTIQAAEDHCFDGECHTTFGSSPNGLVQGKVRNIPEALTVATPAKPETMSACPNGGNIGAPGVTTTLPPGDYLCQNLNLAGTINISGTSGRVRIWIENQLSAAGGTVVNKQQRPIRMQLLQATPADGQPFDGEICGAEIWGLLYTPGLEIKCNGSNQPSIYGAVVANLHDGAGNHFKFHWDVSTRNALNDGKYHVRNWRECSVSATDC